jgi:hypothetical protein
MVDERGESARLGLLATGATLCWLVACGGAAAKPVITSFDPPGSTNTQPTSINASGVIAGQYNDTAGVPHGFVRAANGTITGFDTKGSTATRAAGINGSGVITGQYNDPDVGAWGYVRSATGTIHVFSDGGEVGSNADPTCINDGGTIAGSFGGTDTFIHGFIRSPGWGVVAAPSPQRAGGCAARHPRCVCSFGGTGMLF